MTKVYPFLFLLLVFGSLISAPLFIINTPQIGFHIISQALAEESSEEESSDSGDDEEKESDEQSDEESDEQTCVEPEETEAESEDQESEESCENQETDEESDEQSEEETEEAEETQETEEESNEEPQETQEAEEIQNDETSNSVTEANEPTVLDAILSDDSLLKQVVDDNSTEPGLASALTVIQEDQNQLATETCANEADDDGDGIVDEDCAPSTLPPTETCGNETDDDGDGTIDEEDCVIIQAEICDNGLDDDADGKTDTADEDDCSVILPAVVIKSAEDEEGEPLSRGDLIAPGEVTFTFSTEAGLTTQGSQADSQDYEFECALDDESFNLCSSPMTYEMEAGKHDFVVRLIP